MFDSIFASVLVATRDRKYIFSPHRGPSDDTQKCTDGGKTEGAFSTAVKNEPVATRSSKQVLGALAFSFLLPPSALKVGTTHTHRPRKLNSDLEQFLRPQTWPQSRLLAQAMATPHVSSLSPKHRLLLILHSLRYTRPRDRHFQRPSRTRCLPDGR